MTITEFLLARIAEDEAVAREATIGRWGIEPHLTNPPRPIGVVAFLDGTFTGVVAQVGERPADLDHIRRWQPSRVLAECEAKRETVEDNRDCEWACAADDGPNCRNCITIGRLAAIYATHPDYREEWRAD